VAEARDYSEVVWPWENEPNWDAPREGATSNPATSANWQLQCKFCGLTLPDDYTIATFQAHMQGQHGTDRVELNLVWVGLGTPPQPLEGLVHE
jgi:hypothetical protein